MLGYGLNKGSKRLPRMGGETALEKVKNKVGGLENSSSSNPIDKTSDYSQDNDTDKTRDSHRQHSSSSKRNLGGGTSQTHAEYKESIAKQKNQICEMAKDFAMSEVGKSLTRGVVPGLLGFGGAVTMGIEKLTGFNLGGRDMINSSKNKSI